MPVPHIKLKQSDLTDLAVRIEGDYTAAIDSHQIRIQRWTGYYRRFLNLLERSKAGQEDRPNIREPLTQEKVLVQLAKEIDSIFGKEAEVEAEPVGPSDFRTARKVGRFMSWRVLNSMKITRKLAIFDFRRILFGRAFAWAPWWTEEDEEGQVHYDGPGFFPLAPDDILVPPYQSAMSVHEFPWAMRRFRASVSELLRGEEQGAYQGIKKNLERLKSLQNTTTQREEDQPVRDQETVGEGVIYDSSAASRTRGSLRVWEYYAPLDQYDSRQREVQIRYLPDAKLIVGVQYLADIYPGKRRKRPIVEGAFLPHGAYWGLGLGQILEQFEDELTANSRLFTEAGQFSVGSVIFAKPNSTTLGRQSDPIQPGMVYYTDDPDSLKQIQFAFDPNFCVLKEQMTRASAERVTGLTDYAVGRDVQRPTAPRTATGLVMLVEEGNVRIALNTKILAEDMSDMLSHFWELECCMGNEQTFFRVTEEDAQGLFRVSRGGAVMTSQELAGKYDFKLKFATTPHQREMRAQKLLVLYDKCLANPLFQTQPYALWLLTAKVWRELLDEDFGDVVPQPPMPDHPILPQEEWTRILQGEEVHVNVLDNDDEHILKHGLQAQAEMDAPQPDKSAILALHRHVIQHQQQKQQKMLMQSLVAGLANSLQQNSPGTPGLHVAPPVSQNVMTLGDQMQGLMQPPEQQPGAAPGGMPGA